MDIQIVAAVATIIASVYGILRFMLKDTHKEVELIKKGQEEFKQEMREFNLDLKHVNNRLDGLYRILLDKTYGKNIPEDLK